MLKDDKKQIQQPAPQKKSNIKVYLSDLLKWLIDEKQRELISDIISISYVIFFLFAFIIIILDAIANLQTPIIVTSSLIIIGFLCLIGRAYIPHSAADKELEKLDGTKLKHSFDLEERWYNRYVYLSRTANIFSAIFISVALLFFILSFQSSLNTGEIDSINYIRIQEAIVFFLLGISFQIIKMAFPRDAVERKKKEFELQLLLKKNIIDASETPDSYAYREIRAELQLAYFEAQLMKYYEQNLEQNGKIFTFGIIFIFIGIGIIITILVIVFLFPKINFSISIITAISGLAAQLIGGVFLTMYRHSATLTNNFHTKFVETNTLYMASLATAKIKDGDIRDEIYSEIAKNLSHKIDIANS